MVRKWVALGLFLVAVAGLVLTIVGICTTKYTVKTRHYEVDYDLATKEYFSTSTGEKLDGPDKLVNWSSATANQEYVNAKNEWKEVPTTAENMRSTPIWIGAITLLVFGVAALATWNSIRYY